jgi:hypothetical protein
MKKYEVFIIFTAYNAEKYSQLSKLEHYIHDLLNSTAPLFENFDFLLALSSIFLLSESPFLLLVCMHLSFNVADRVRSMYG